MIKEWLLIGAEFGFSAFAAVFVFCVCCIAAMSVVAILGRIIGGGNQDGEVTRKPD